MGCNSSVYAITTITGMILFCFVFACCANIIARFPYVKRIIVPYNAINEEYPKLEQMVGRPT